MKSIDNMMKDTAMFIKKNSVNGSTITIEITIDKHDDIYKKTYGKVCGVIETPEVITEKMVIEADDGDYIMNIINDVIFFCKLHTDVKIVCDDYATTNEDMAIELEGIR